MDKTQVALPQDHPLMLAWNKFKATAEYANTLAWALREKYDDGRQISAEMRNNHVEGALWLAFTGGIEDAGAIYSHNEGNKNG